MVAIKNIVWKMVDKFSESHFTLAVASHMVYDEYISNFITYLAGREKQPEAAIAGLNLDQMKPKEFD